MNSKLFSRIVAVVLSVLMLSTVSFAAEVTLGGEDNDQFTVGNDDEYIAANEQMTLMAYTVSQEITNPENIPAYSVLDHLLVAVDQKANTESFGTVKFNTARVEADRKVAVVLSGTSGTPLKMLLSTEDIHLVKNITTGVESLATADTIDITDEATQEVTTYKDVKVFGCSYTPDNNAAVRKVNFNLASSKAGSTSYDVAVDDLERGLDGEGTFTFRVALIGLPREYVGNNPTYTITATPSVDVEYNLVYTP